MNMATKKTAAPATATVQRIKPSESMLIKFDNDMHQSFF